MRLSQGMAFNEIESEEETFRLNVPDDIRTSQYQ